MSKCFPAYINLLKTAIGSGILTYPYLFKIYGIAPTIVISAIAAFFSYFGLMLYIEANIYLSKNKQNVTLSSLATACYPKSKIIADFAICFKCFGVAISYLIIVRQLLPLVLINLFGDHLLTTPTISLLIFLAITSPLSFFKKIDKLKYTSFCGIACITIMIFSTFYRVYEAKEFKTNDIKFKTPLSILWITGIGKFVFSFTCHQNIFTVQNEVNSDENTNDKTMVKLVGGVVLTAFTAYIIFGIMNYIIYGNLILDNILESFPDDRLSIFIQGLYVIVMGFSYPLQINPCRLYFIELFSLHNTADNLAGNSDINHNKRVFGKELGEDGIVRIIVTFMMLLFSFLVAISGIELGSIYSIIGATAGSMMCYVFPGVFYLKLDIPCKKGGMICMSVISIVFGVLLSSSAIAILFSQKI